MNSIYLDKKDLNNFKIISSSLDSITYTDNINIYKLVSNPVSIADTVIKINNIMPDLNVSLLHINGVIKGYSMPYFIHTNSFKDLINSDITDEIKLNCIKESYKFVKRVHKMNLIIDDIALNKFITNNTKCIYTSLESISANQEFNLSKKVINFRTDKPIFNNTFCTNNIEMMIISLSLLFNIDFEEYVKEHSIVSLKNLISRCLDKNDLDLIIDYIINNYYTDDPIYFDDIVRDNFQHINFKEASNALKKEL